MTILTPSVEISPTVEKPQKLKSTAEVEATMTSIEYSNKPVHNITNVSYVQRISRKALKAIHKNRKSLEKDTEDMIHSLHTKLRGNKLIYENPISYSFQKSTPGQLGYGRYLGSRGSLETLERAVRGSLCGQYYYDVDVVNCHPVIIPQMAKRYYNLDMPHLNNYVENRQQYFDLMKEKFNYSDDETKEIIIKFLYGGACPSTIKLSNDWEEKMPSAFHDIKKEMVQFTNKLMKDDNHKALYTYIKSLKKKNEGGSLTSWIIQTEERKILDSLVHYLIIKAFFVDVLAYDGCQVRKCDDMPLTQEILDGAIETIKKETGYDIKLKIKPFTVLELDDDDEKEEGVLPEDVIVDDKYACEVFIATMGNDIIKKGGVIWIYNPSNGLWETGDSGILSAVLNHSNVLVFKQYDKDGNIKTFNYGGSTKNIKQMLHQLDALLQPTSSTEYSLEKSKGYILFKNGYYDMKERIFNHGFDDTCRSKFFTKRVIRDFIDTRNEEVENLVNRVIFENPYNNPIVGSYYKYIIARATGGHIEDKTWTSIIGNPNCGKGVISAILKYVFDEYVGFYNPNVLKFNTRDGTDEAKKLAWYVPLIGCRIALGNEIRLDGKALDGNQMKTLSSGGDTLQLRNNFKDQIDVDMVSTFFTLLNDMPPVAPCDKALKNRLKCIPHTKSFVNKPQSECSEYEMESDPELKDKIKTADWINAFFWIIMDAYHNPIAPPQEVIDESDEHFVVEDVKLKEVLEEEYSFVSSELYDKDKLTSEEKETLITSRDIIQYLSDHNIKMSDTKIGRELKKLGLKSKKVDINKRKIVCYFGLQRV